MKLKKSYIGTRKCMDMDEKPNEGYIIVMILHQQSNFYYYPYMLVNFRLFWCNDFVYPCLNVCMLLIKHLITQYFLSILPGD